MKSANTLRINGFFGFAWLSRNHFGGKKEESSQNQCFDANHFHGYIIWFRLIIVLNNMRLSDTTSCQNCIYQLQSIDYLQPCKLT